MTKLLAQLAPNVSIDVQRLVETRLLLQANSGGGKSYALRKLCETTYGGPQQILIDVEGEFHSLREKYDYVLAGQKGGDCPADCKSAALLARRLLELNVSAIIDIYELGAQRQRFVKLFLESMMSAPRELWHPVLVIIDEAHMFCPEKDKAESAHAVIDLMTRGRKRGFCGVLATQRISKLSKDAAAECNNKLIGRCGLDIDMRRASAELGMSNSTDMLGLRALKAGQFYAFGPAICDDVRTIKIGEVQTTHPRAGERAAPPTPPRASVKRILAQLADLPKEVEVEQQTVSELRTRVRDLERQIKITKLPETALSKTKVEKVRIFDPKQVAVVERAVDKLAKVTDTLAQAQQVVVSELHNFRSMVAIQLGKVAQAEVNNKHADNMLRQTVIDLAMKQRTSARIDAPPAIGAQRHPPMGTGRMAVPKGIVDASPLAKGPRNILTALIQYPAGLRREQLTVLTGYKATSLYEFLRILKQEDLTVEQGDIVRATDVGVRALPDAAPLPVGSELQDWWRHRLSKGERALLDVLIEAYPEAVTNEALEEATKYKATSRYEYMRQLAAKKLVSKAGRGLVMASPTLFD